MIDKTLVGNSIVVISSGFNPSMFNAYWMVENEVISEEDLNNDNIFTKQFVEINTSTYVLTINQNSFQFHSKNGSQGFEYSLDVLKQLIKKTQDTIYLSAGINYNWFLETDEESYKALSRKLFYVSDNRFYEEFNHEEDAFGGYISTDFKSARMKLDMKPAVASKKGGEENGVIHFNFNFHNELPKEERVTNLLSYIDSWADYYKESDRIINKIDGN